MPRKGQKNNMVVHTTEGHNNYTRDSSMSHTVNVNTGARPKQQQPQQYSGYAQPQTFYTISASSPQQNLDVINVAAPITQQPYVYEQQQHINVSQKEQKSSKFSGGCLKNTCRASAYLTCCAFAPVVGPVALCYLESKCAESDRSREFKDEQKERFNALPPEEQANFNAEEKARKKAEKKQRSKDVSDQMKWQKKEQDKKYDNKYGGFGVPHHSRSYKY